LSLSLEALGADGTAPADLTSYDILLANISGGVDSQAMLDELHRRAAAAGVAHRIVAVHADLGPMEWNGVQELAAEHAAHYGVRFETVRHQRDGVEETLLEMVEARGMWPSATVRFCTSYCKRDVIRKLITRLVAEQRARGVTRPVRVLNVMGLRADESPLRGAKPPFRHDGSRTCTCDACQALPRDRRGTGISNSRRHVDEWLPVHSWSKADVWERVREAGTRPHPVYRRLPRLSCRFCVLASKAALVEAARIDPEGAAEYAAVEARIGHRFRQDLSMAEVRRLAAADPDPAGRVADWVA
jgi:3'-phosphoadenosine 5'-phosphosulfate sulfotransferase (PAPS reductase)/FAD synthetase